MANEAEFTVSACPPRLPSCSVVLLSSLAEHERGSANSDTMRRPRAVANTQLHSRPRHAKLHSDDFFCGGTPW